MSSAGRLPWVSRAALRALIATGALVFGALMLGAAPAAAHAGITTTTPTHREVVQEAPEQVVLRFNEPVGTDLGGVRIIGPDSSRVDAGGAAAGDDASQVTVRLNDVDREGTYLVSWRVVSADGHPVLGAFVYSVRVETGAPQADPADLTAAQNPATTIALGVCRFFGFAAMCLLVGGVVFIGWLWPDGADRVFVRTLLGWAWSVAFLSSILTLLLYGPYTAGLGPAAGLQLPLLGQALSTPVGESFLVRGLALLVAGVLLVFSGVRTARGRRLRRWHAPLLLAVLAVALVAWSRGGHAGSAGPAYTLNMALHFAAVGMWLGGLALLTAGLRPAADETSDTEASELAGPLEGWSKLTAVSVAVIAVTGVVSAIREVELVEALWSTTYGLLLVFKVALVALMLLLGNAGRLWIRRRTRNAAASRVGAPTGGADNAGEDDEEPEDPAEAARREVAALRYNTGAEAVIAAMVLVVTTVLVETLPAKDAFAPPYSEVQKVGTFNVQTDFEPARVGVNQIHIYVTDEAGRPIDAPEITGGLRLPEESVGPLPLTTRRVSAGHFEVRDLVVPLKGRWTVEMSVRTSDVEESTFRQTVRVR